jgi:hypothetical protein
MTDKFENVPVEADTRILFRDNNVKVGERTARYEMWSWDGIHGESLIFATEDVSGLTDEDFKTLLTDGDLLKSPENFTVTRKSDFVFVNYNAEMV